MPKPPPRPPSKREVASATRKYIRRYLKFSDLGGGSVSLEEVTAELALLPLDGVLGVVAGFSLLAVQHGKQFLNLSVQAQYIRRAVLDDFPRKLATAPEIIQLNELPAVPTDSALVHEQNLALLTHLALLHADRGDVTNEINEPLLARVCRLLLICSDLLGEERKSAIIVPETNETTMTERRELSLEVLRLWQFNRFFESPAWTCIRLARERKIYVDFLPKRFPEHDISALFQTKKGASISELFGALVLLISHFADQSKTGPGKHVFSKEILFRNIRKGRANLEALLASWIRKPEEYVTAYSEWNCGKPGGRLGFDFVPLRERPIIEARSNDLFFPVLPFLFGSVSDAPFFSVCDALRSVDPKLPDKFGTARGLAYEDYGSELVDRIAKSDRGEAWQVYRGRDLGTSFELFDSYLQRGEIGICFEHKGLRTDNEFLRGVESERVIGPSKAILEKLDSGQAIGLDEGKKNDRGLLTRGLWQQSTNGTRILDWAEKETGVRPTILYPILTHLADVHVDYQVRHLYIDPLIRAAGLYREDFWAPPEWLHVSDLEELASRAERGEVDLVALLSKKSASDPASSFDVFICSEFGCRWGDAKLLEDVENLAKWAQEFFREPLS